MKIKRVMKGAMPTKFTVHPEIRAQAKEFTSNFQVSSILAPPVDHAKAFCGLMPCKSFHSRLINVPSLPELLRYQIIVFIIPNLVDETPR